MKIFENIKFQYHVKEIEDLLSKNKLNDIKLILKGFSSQNKPLLYKILKHFFLKFISVRSTESIFNNNLILINSFLPDDKKIITQFLKFYFKHVNFTNYQLEDYSKKAVEIKIAINPSETFGFQEMISNSIIYQMIMSIEKEDNLTFLNNDFAFFSSDNSYNFCDSGQIKCFFHIIDHPYKVYSMLKNKFEDQKELIQNEMFNFDGKNKYILYDGVNLEIVQKGWNIYSKSWNDPDVVNTMRGSLFYKDDFSDNPLETYTNVVLHLRQSGVDVPLNYNTINSYIESMLPNSSDDHEVNLSNHEKKFIRNNCEEFVSDFNFEFL